MILIDKKDIKKIDINKLLKYGTQRDILKVDIQTKNGVYKEVDWIINKDNMISHFGYNFYIRTQKACNKEYQPKTLGIAYRAIKRTLMSNSMQILNIYFNNEKNEKLEDILK